MAEEDTTTEDDTSTDNTESSEETTTTTSDDEVAKWKALARKHEKEAKRLKAFEAEANKAKEQSKTEAEKALDKAKTEAADAAGKEATAKAKKRVLNAELRAAAVGKLADPSDAFRYPDLVELPEVDDDLEVDANALNKAIADLLKAKPNLAATPKGRGSADNGARSGSGDTNQSISPQERLRRAYSTTK